MQRLLGIPKCSCSFAGLGSAYGSNRLRLRLDPILKKSRGDADRAAAGGTITSEQGIDTIGQCHDAYGPAVWTRICYWSKHQYVVVAAVNVGVDVGLQIPFPKLHRCLCDFPFFTSWLESS